MSENFSKRRRLQASDEANRAVARQSIPSTSKSAWREMQQRQQSLTLPLACEGGDDSSAAHVQPRQMDTTAYSERVRVQIARDHASMLATLHSEGNAERQQVEPQAHSGLHSSGRDAAHGASTTQYRGRYEGQISVHGGPYRGAPIPRVIPVPTISNERSERPPRPQQSPMLENALLLALRSLEKAVANGFSDLSSRLRSLENATVTMKGSICGAIDGVRTDNNAQNEKYLECQRDVGDKICDTLSSLSAVARDNSGSLEADPQGQQHDILSHAQEYVKYATCLEYLDPTKGCALYCRKISQSRAIESQIVRDGANFVLEESTDSSEFLKRKSSVRRNRKMVEVDDASLIGRGQSAALETIRKELIASFTSSCPTHCVLHTCTTLAGETATAALAEMYDNSKHKYDATLVTAWLAAQRAGMNAAFRAAKSSHTLLTTKYPGRQLSALPVPPSNSNYLQSSLFNIGFVSFKVSKYVQSLSAGKRGVQHSHGPDWAREVLFLHEKLVQALEADSMDDSPLPVFLAIDSHEHLGVRAIEELNRLI